MYRFFLIVLASLILTACATPPSQIPTSAPEGNYRLDPEHTSVLFSLSHGGLSNFTGRFDTISGSLDFNPDMPQESRLEIQIETDSISTGLEDFDRELAQDKKYFDAESHPAIHFRATGIEITGANKGLITGDLSLKGVTKPVSLDVIFNGSGKSFGHLGKTLGFSATGTFRRSDFNIGYLTNFGIGDEITLRIESEFNENPG